MDVEQIHIELQQLKGRMIAADFAIKMLMAHLPDLPAFQAHWAHASMTAMDGALDYSSSICTHTANQALTAYAALVEAEQCQRRK